MTKRFPAGIRKSRSALAVLIVTCCIVAFASAPAYAEDLLLNENCTISILNRTAQVQPDGSWGIDNVPANFGAVRARATCVEAGVTLSGQSGLVTTPRLRTHGEPFCLIPQP